MSIWFLIKEKSTGQVIKGEGTTNKDWWPNQLDLKCTSSEQFNVEPHGRIIRL